MKDGLCRALLAPDEDLPEAQRFECISYCTEKGGWIQVTPDTDADKDFSPTTSPSAGKLRTESSYVVDVNPRVALEGRALFQGHDLCGLSL